MRVLVTGGAGYIGSHTSISLLEKGNDVVIVDNLRNSKRLVIDRIEELSSKKVTFYPYDVCNIEKMREIFENEKIDAVIHFAGLKAVGESVQKPLEYYQNNLGSTLALLQVMQEYKVDNLIFSSSATVYGDPATVPIKEDFPLSTTNPYGTTKLMIERILTDYAEVNPQFNPIILRYFNPVGAHESGRIGEDPKGVPNNLLPYVMQVAIGKLEKVRVWGNDYKTIDGTGERDYIHVVDLAEGHVAVLQLFEKQNCGLNIFNLGSGKGNSVLEIIEAVSKTTGKEIPYEICARRAGDIDSSFSDCTKIFNELGWKTERTLDEICASSWKWQQMNPNGYDE